MHSVCVQFLFKINILKCSNFPLARRCYSTKQKSSKNHYDTLKITPHATQNEVKTAYYKLTLQYHPDKNQSEYAKQKFQDISDAYEVLGNHELRKNYDRRMTLHQQPKSSTDEESTSQYRSTVYSGTSKIYNFDAWTRAHYGKQMYADRLRRNAYKNYVEMEKLKGYERNRSKNPDYVLGFFIVIVLIIGYFYQEKYDVPVSNKRKTENKNSSD